MSSIQCKKGVFFNQNVSRDLILLKQEKFAIITIEVRTKFLIMLVVLG